MLQTGKGGEGQNYSRDHQNSIAFLLRNIFTKPAYYSTNVDLSFAIEYHGDCLETQRDVRNFIKRQRGISQLLYIAKWQIK